MNNKKIVVYGAFLGFAMIAVASILINHESTFIKVKTVDGYDKAMSTVNNKINKLDDGICKEYFTYYYNYINDTYFTEDVSLKDYLDAYYTSVNIDGEDRDVNSLYYYTYISDKCNIKYDEKLYVEVLKTMIFPDEIKNRYNLNYEIGIKDLIGRNKTYSSHDQLGTYTTKVGEIQLLNDLLDEVIK
ncbi:MAG TPA: hypothetical protein PLB45_01305 [Bacilli bacterium]|nr:hypothetical protein [Bacilli bacterium]